MTATFEMKPTFETTTQAFVRRIRLINWHGHENATFEISGGMLAVIGENGSGKSLVLDAIDWALFPAPNKQFNAAAREGGRQSRRTLSNTILFFDPHGVDRPDRGWRRARTVGYSAVEVEHDNGERWTYGSAAAATPHSAHPWYYALPGALERVVFLADTGQGRAPLQYPEFRKANEALVHAGGEIFSAAQSEDYNRTVARRLLNIEGGDWERRYDALYDVLHRMLGLKVDDALVADPSSVVRQFLPVIDRPHLERLVEGLEGIQHIHRDIEEYGKLATALQSVVEARHKYHETIVQYGAMSWLRAAWADDDKTKALESAEIALGEARAASTKAEADEEAAYTEEAASRRELEALQQLHQGEVVQAVSRANAGVQAAIREQERTARDLRNADERLVRAEQVVTASLAALTQERESTATRVNELRARARDALGTLPTQVDELFARLAEAPGDERAADALFNAAQQLDRDLGALEAQVELLNQARAAVTAAKQAERDAQTRHTANEQASGRARQSLRARWERLAQRWPRDVMPAPASEPAPQSLPSLMDAAVRELDLARAAGQQAMENATRLNVRGDALREQIATLDTELARPVEEARLRLSPPRERALQQLLTVDRAASPVFQRLDFRAGANTHAEAIEALLAQADYLTSVRLGVPLATLRGALAGQTDWRVVVDTAPMTRPAPNSVAAALETPDSAIRCHA